ncbi:hypothetical protein PR048_026423 [Dryococelus australis]|uniref:Uncharacterized protein n=1 Tax=Dryococelus australis TaxID=614101 RepID=A0ABQ9GLA8_9NEOP|nr:hypothetical protein PR048_026423 [Dryococelus australis]
MCFGGQLVVECLRERQLALRTHERYLAARISAVLLLGSNLVPHNSLSTVTPWRHRYSDILPSFTVLESTPDSTAEAVTVFPKVELFLGNLTRHSRRNRPETDFTSASSCVTGVGPGAAVAERLDCSPHNMASRVHSPAGSLPDFHMCELCRTRPLVGLFSRGSPHFPRSFITALLHTHIPSPSSALKTSHSLLSRVGERTIQSQGRQVATKRRHGESGPLMWAYSLSDWLRQALGTELVSDWLLRATKASLLAGVPAGTRLPNADWRTDMFLASGAILLQFANVHEFGVKRVLKCVSAEILEALNAHALRTDKSETRDTGENPSTSGIVRHDSQVRIFGSDPGENRALFAHVGAPSTVGQQAHPPTCHVTIVQSFPFPERSGPTLAELPSPKLQRRYVVLHVHLLRAYFFFLSLATEICSGVRRIRCGSHNSLRGEARARAAALAGFIGGTWRLMCLHPSPLAALMYCAHFGSVRLFPPSAQATGESNLSSWGAAEERINYLRSDNGCSELRTLNISRIGARRLAPRVNERSQLFKKGEDMGDERKHYGLNNASTHPGPRCRTMIFNISRLQPPMRLIEVSMEQRRNKRARETGDPLENPPTCGNPGETPTERGKPSPWCSSKKAAKVQRVLVVLEGLMCAFLQPEDTDLPALESRSRGPSLTQEGSEASVQKSVKFTHSYAQVPRLLCSRSLMTWQRFDDRKMRVRSYVSCSQCRTLLTTSTSVRRELNINTAWRGKREIPEKTRRPTSSSCTIPTCEKPGVTRPGVEPGSPWWEASSVTAQPLCVAIHRVWEPGDPREDPPPSGIVLTFLTCESPGATRPGIEPGSPWWEASSLTTRPPRPRKRLYYGAASCKWLQGPLIFLLCVFARNGASELRQKPSATAFPRSRVGYGCNLSLPPSYCRPLPDKHRHSLASDGGWMYFITQQGVSGQYWLVANLISVISCTFLTRMSSASDIDHAARLSQAARRKPSSSTARILPRPSILSTAPRFAAPAGTDQDRYSHESARATRRCRARTQLTSLWAGLHGTQWSNGPAHEPAGPQQPPYFDFSSNSFLSSLNMSHKRLACLPPTLGEPRSIPGRVTPGLSQVGIVPGVAADRRVFSGNFGFSRRCIPALLRAHLTSPSSALKTSLVNLIRLSVHNPVYPVYVHIAEDVYPRHCEAQGPYLEISDPYTRADLLAELTSATRHVLTDTSLLLSRLLLCIEETRCSLCSAPPGSSLHHARPGSHLETFCIKEARLPGPEAQQRASYKGDTATRIKCAIAATRRALNWRAVLSRGRGGLAVRLLASLLGDRVRFYCGVASGLPLYGVVLECKGGGSRRSPRKLINQRRRKARFPLGKIREWPGRVLNQSLNLFSAPQEALDCRIWGGARSDCNPTHVSDWKSTVFTRSDILPESEAIIDTTSPQRGRPRAHHLSGRPNMRSCPPVTQPPQPHFKGGGGLAVSPLTSHQGEPVSIPDRATPGFSHVGIVLDEAACRRVYSGISRFRCPCIQTLLHTSITLIGSQDLDVKSHPNLFTLHNRI